ncbi:MAG: peptide ABC transporter substrate-binding protein [Myxococcales bacterium]|nr:peptide ABC transporter substrate-binding protein [Myxococcales bacterium]
MSAIRFAFAISIALTLSLTALACKKRTSGGSTTPSKVVGRDGSSKRPRSGTHGERPPADRVFRWGSNFPRFIDPNRVTETPGNYLAQNLFEGLLNHNQGAGEPQPGVATHFELSHDGRTYTFHLRHNARWSNGDPVTARDFEYSWKRSLTPDFVSENVELIWQFVDGAKAYKLGKQKDWSTVGVKVLDDYTLEVRLSHPAPFFPYLVAYIAYAPVPKKAVERYGSRWTRPEHIVVNGPYTITSFKERDRITLLKNPRYWDAKSVRIERWELVHVERETEAVKMYNLGQIHYLSDLVPTELIPQYKRQNRKDFHIDPVLCTYYIKFNTKKKPFDDVRVRRAFNLAVNKDELVTNMLQTGQVPATNFIPLMFEKTHHYRSPKGPYFNPSAARKLLAEAGYSAANFPKVTLLFNAAELHQTVASFVQGQLKRHVGVEIDLQKMEWKSLIAKLHKKDFTLARTGWCADYPDPLAFLSPLQSQSENNDPGYKNLEFDTTLAQIKSAAERKRRNELLAKAERTLIRDMPQMPLFHYTRVYLIKSFIGGYEPNVMDYHLVKYLYFR